MEAFIYLGKVSLYWVLLYACYWFLLRQHTFFRWNRTYLLGALLLAFVLPLIKYPERIPVMPTAVYAVAKVPVVVVAPEAVVYTAAQTTHWSQFLWVVYGLGVLLMAGRLYNYLRDLFNYLHQGETIELDECTLVLMNTDEVGSFSFWKWVVVSRSDYEQHFDAILRHELVHVQQRHSFDILLVEVLRVLFWFNPVLIFYKNSLQQVHEYLADEEAPERDRYAAFLVSYALGAPLATLTNHFFTSSLLKQRIKMLYKNRNSPWTLGRYLAVVPLIGLVLMLTAARQRLITAIEKGKYVPKGTLSDASTSLSERLETFLEEPLALLTASEEKTTVTGTVTNQDGQPLPSAAIIAKGTTAGTTTNQQGTFELKDVPLNSTIVISFVGYQPQEIRITEKNQTINARLLRQKQSLEEVVVVGYGSIKPASTDTARATTPEGTFTIVEQMPEFPGGTSELYKYLARNIMYPTEASRKEVQGRVLVSFLVSEEGAIREPKIVNGLGAGIDEEALRVVLSMPRWKPARQNGRPVAMLYQLPIQFMLEKDEVPLKAPLEAPKEDKEKRTGLVLPKFRFEDAVDMDATAKGKPVDESEYRYSVPFKKANLGILKVPADDSLESIQFIGDKEYQPLYLLDNVPVDQKTFLDLPPDTIHSIEIKKGDHSPMYGKKGKNGVVLISTKKGKK
ncbi:hypothetical protein GCM10027275_29880 [Rhabdobacter roseus]|uniref:TonB family protein n=1 Tax=Rhabdobacter roseus TaxID=1655419 RepID=A0A840TUK2_9BACT|nr:M56 family metallopeptidase [Rhabdobacter roseus]MBB5284943.1 TonB family protein [Rhabdobacter roseus]